MESRLDKVIETYNEYANGLESGYLENREEPNLNIKITREDLNTIIIGTGCIDNHNIKAIHFNNGSLTVELTKIVEH